ncbi:hypothetical protein E2542_SST20340 [Spatholobus suberectus]|nr:hypothetical protein E2542_SST20340 [Spatholobus suberectus]
MAMLIASRSGLASFSSFQSYQLYSRSGDATPKCHVEKEDLPQPLEEVKLRKNNQTILRSFFSFPLLCVVAFLPEGEAMRSMFGPFVELVKLWNLLD